MNKTRGSSPGSLFLLSLAGAALLAVVLAVCAVHALANGNGWQADFKSTATITNHAAIPASLKSIEVDNYYGAIDLCGAATGEFFWTQTVTVHAKTDTNAQAVAQAECCRAEVAGDSLKLIVPPPQTSPNNTIQSDFAIQVPAGVSVRTHNRYSSTVIASVAGPVNATSESGSVSVRDITNEVNLATSYAALHVDHTGKARLKNQSGSIEATDIHGALAAETSYASVHARDIAGAVRVQNQSGRVSVERAASARVQTSYASIEVAEIAGDATLTDQSGSVTARGVSGKVRAETSYAALDITGAGSDIECTDQSGAIRVHATSAALARLKATTSYAPVEIWLSRSLPAPALSAQTSYGAVESDFPVQPTPSADLPAGAPRITLEDQSAKIRVIRE